MEIKFASHCSYRVRYHMVFVVKYRRHMLLEQVPLEYFNSLVVGIGERYDFSFDAIGLEEDHFHILVEAPPRYAPSQIMQIIKSVSARQIFKEHPKVKQFLWGGEFWSDGGHIDTVSEFGGLDVIKKYVENQGRNKDQLKLTQF